MRMKTLKYAVECNGKYLQGIKPNKHYSRTGTAPTMGARHCFHEYETVWGDEFKVTEPLTMVSYVKVLFEEYRWEEKEPIEIKIIPYFELLGMSEQLVRTNDMLIRDNQKYEVVIADDNIFVVCPVIYDKEEQSEIVKYDKAEIYANQTDINTLAHLNFTLLRR